MKGMKGNEHCDWAKNLYEAIIGGDEKVPFSKSVPVMLAAQVQATLALAYEQRTANLIALAHMEHRNGTGIGFHRDYDSATIHERLGMG